MGFDSLGYPSGSDNTSTQMERDGSKWDQNISEGSVSPTVILSVGLLPAWQLGVSKLHYTVAHNSFTCESGINRPIIKL